MAKFTKFRVLVVLAAIVAASVVGVATAAPPDHAQSEHQRIVEFWTHARVAQAVPRDFVLDANGLVPRGKPSGTPGNGGGGGGGGGDTTDPSLVTGASWDGTGEKGTVKATTGKVLFAFGNSYYICSASTAVDTSTSSSLVLTAAHCAYDSGFASNWVFIPDYDSAPEPLSTNQAAYCPETAYGCWTASALTVHSNFTLGGGFSLATAPYDYAFATVGAGGHGKWVDDVLQLWQLDATVGTQAISFSALTLGDEANAFGYPAAKKYKGDDLVYCAGPVGTDSNNGGATYRLLCDMTGGSSGGPWFSDFAGTAQALSSVNSYGYRGGDSMYGPMFNDYTATVYDVANGGADENVLTGAPGSNP